MFMVFMLLLYPGPLIIYFKLLKAPGTKTVGLSGITLIIIVHNVCILNTYNFFL